MEPERLVDSLPSWIEEETTALLNAPPGTPFPRPGVSCVGGIFDVFHSKEDESLPPCERVCFTFTDARKCIFAFLSPEAFNDLTRRCGDSSDWTCLLLHLLDFEFVSVLRKGYPRAEIALYIKSFEKCGLAVHFADQIGAVEYILDCQEVKQPWTEMSMSSRYKIAPLAKKLQCPPIGVFKGEGNQQLARTPFKTVTGAEVKRKARLLGEKRNEHEEIPEISPALETNEEGKYRDQGSESSCSVEGVGHYDMSVDPLG
eukprot:gb/GECG01010057.1/.p1 GENE.gb/GECG01010057.1/~~gb/GECG01010057.1/.p1  ORF type:complete len:258 (+),score=25.07 gb/GECG01010057.1/:1-774(+)